MQKKNIRKLGKKDPAKADFRLKVFGDQMYPEKD